ncbi:hypothetical protein PENNAL_c0117G09566 [Penicillium nalgiovense]|uniref:Uncharacterized protein n=1 Tax=Penicillium nalgiovense TaxID=60175 RepID=A0A1V6X5J0_PENNA|nr:hypothetical protein PENNAL_c0117G09566 [Penicillium nalgiovense]
MSPAGGPDPESLGRCTVAEILGSSPLEASKESTSRLAGFQNLLIPKLRLRVWLGNCKAYLPTRRLFILILKGSISQETGIISVLQIYVLPLDETYLVDIYTLKEKAFLQPASNNDQTILDILQSPRVSKEQHMLIMKHASPCTFLNHYHPLQPDTDMIRVIYSLDPDVEDNSELEEARRNLGKPRAQYEETQEPGLLPRLQQREKAAAVKEENEDKSSLEDTMHPLQLHLAQSLPSYHSNSLEDEWHLRDTGTAAVVQYCDVLEGGPLRGRPKRKAPGSAPPTGPIAQPKDLQQTWSDVDSCKVPAPLHGKPLRATREYLEAVKQPEACFQCFASEGLPDKTNHSTANGLK